MQTNTIPRLKHDKSVLAAENSQLKTASTCVSFNLEKSIWIISSYSPQVISDILVCIEFINH